MAGCGGEYVAFVGVSIHMSLCVCVCVCMMKEEGG